MSGSGSKEERFNISFCSSIATYLVVCCITCCQIHECMVSLLAFLFSTLAIILSRTRRR